MKINMSLIFTALCLSLLIGCKKDDVQKKPLVQTLQSTLTINNSIVLNGVVSDENGSAVIERGFYWSALPNVDLNDSILTSGKGSGEFNKQLDMLPKARTYYYKAFATNSSGTSVGDEMSFKTEEIPALITIYESGYDHETNKAFVRYRIVSGSLPIISHGICYDLQSTPTINNSVIEVSQDPGTFLIELDDLLLQNEYFLRIFVRETNDVFYSDEVSISTYKLGPTLTLIEGQDYVSNDTTIQAQTQIKFGVNGNDDGVSGNLLSRFKFSIISNNISTTYFDSTFSSDSFTWENDLNFTSAGEARLLFELWDKGGMKAEQTFNVTIENHTAINKFVDVEFGSWNDVVGSFFSSTEGITYTISQTSTTPMNQAKIDFLFFKGATNQNTMASPDDADANTINELKLNLWTNKNQTRFNATNITATQFDAIGTTYQFPAFNLSAQTSKMNNLVNGQVFLFKTKNGKLGLVKIVDLYSRGDRAKASIIVQK
jgi:hypothetical protein